MRKMIATIVVTLCMITGIAFAQDASQQGMNQMKPAMLKKDTTMMKEKSKIKSSMDHSKMMKPSMKDTAMTHSKMMKSNVKNSHEVDETFHERLDEDAGQNDDGKERRSYEVKSIK